MTPPEDDCLIDVNTDQNDDSSCTIVVGNEYVTFPCKFGLASGLPSNFRNLSTDVKIFTLYYLLDYGYCDIDYYYITTSRFLPVDIVSSEFIIEWNEYLEHNYINEPFLILWCDDNDDHILSIEPLGKSIIVSKSNLPKLLYILIEVGFETPK